jgi:hypothetical protein
MQCPKCQSENFEIGKSCPRCGFQGNPNSLEEVGLFQLQLNQMDEWETFNIDTVPVPLLKEIHTSQRLDVQVALEPRQTSFTLEEAKKAWVELAHLETLFEKVDEWRNAGYFIPEMESLDPVRKQRAHADELRQRLEGYPRPELYQTVQDKLKMVDFLLDSIDLLASRQWFKSKKEIEKVVMPVMAMMLDAISDSLSKTTSAVYN